MSEMPVWPGSLHCQTGQSASSRVRCGPDRTVPGLPTGLQTAGRVAPCFLQPALGQQRMGTCESYSCAPWWLWNETWKMCKVNTCHDFDICVVSFMLLLTIVQKQMSVALLTLSASDLWQSGTNASSGNCLSLDAASRKYPPCATYQKHMEGCWKLAWLQGVPSRGGRMGRHTFHRNSVLSPCIMSVCGHLMSPGPG